MPKHEQYGELSSLAMIGEASAAELRDLKEHLDNCADCRQEYFEFVQFVLPQLSLAADIQPVSDITAEERQAIRSDFLAKAAKAGVRFSAEAVAGRTGAARNQEASPGKPADWSRALFRYGLAAGLAVVIVGGAFLSGRRSAPRTAMQSPNSHQARPTTDGVSGSVAQPGSTVGADSAVADIRASKLQGQLNEALVRLEKAKAALDNSEREQATLRETIDKQNGLLKETLEQKQTSEGARANLEAELEKLQQKESALETDYGNQTAAVVELADKLKQQKATADQQRQLATTDSQIHDLMASRNLHIVDVFDTDTHGKTKSIFGRVFFAENKQLVFYAYDLNELQGRNTRIDYHVWGQKEGPAQSVRSLGVFHPDGKISGRWVFESDDQKLLSAIDSIFVTVEKSDSPQVDPKGQKLMYAYLRDHPNHP